MTKRTKPVYVMFQEGVLEFEKEAVLDGVTELLELAGQKENIEVVDLGVWRNKAYKNNDGSLREFLSIDWYLEQGARNGRNGQLDTDSMRKCLMEDYWFKQPGEITEMKEDHYLVLAVHSDIYHAGTNFVVGSSVEGIGAVVSVNRFEDLSKNPRYECIKTTTMHELGEVFELVPASRTENVEESLGKHCTNACIMRQGPVVPTDIIRVSEDRLKYGALCKTCKEDLKSYFSTPV